MPPRRSHKKSKAGCKRCKIRKIKCDEVHPRCGNCAKHGVSCDFDPTAPDSPTSFVHSPAAASAGGSPHSNFSTASPSSNSTVVPFYRSPLDIVRANINPAASRTLELRLMHHYTSVTSKTFSDSPAQKVAWQEDIPTIAYDAEYLMDAILAVSALHLRALNPSDRSVVRASHGYMASALAKFSSLLKDGVSELNAEALFSTAALIGFQSSASRRFEDGDGEYILPLAWFHSFQGIKTVVMTSWQWLRNSAKVYPIINGQPALRLDLDHSRTSFFAPLLEGMDEQLSSEPEVTREETKRAYEHSVAFLNWAHQKPDRSRILGFAATVSRRFVELIAQQDPRTLVIISCFFAMTKVVDDVWWLHGVAKREVNGIFNLLSEEWWGKMEWPIRIANHEGEMDDILWGGVSSIKDEPGEEEERINIHIDLLAERMNNAAPPMDVD
ncbi:hypothetical protein B0O99DRAFT_206887 [Bisporella sp. PMI_857]|nr:hypothetical protein B0O99DRAFT_206887 [Bisporella sp. PMI_857]